MGDSNLKPEQKARDSIDKLLEQAGWIVQSQDRIDFSAGPGIAIREYQTAVGPADYVLFVDKDPVGAIEAKPDDWGQKITTVEEQSAGYAAAALKWIDAFRGSRGLHRMLQPREPAQAQGDVG